MIGRLILFAALFFVGWLLFRFIRQQIQQRSQQKPPQKHEADSGGVEVLPCARCGVHVPSHTAVFKDGVCYCSEEHRDADR